VADKLVTIAEFTDGIQAELAKQLLADFGIKSVVIGNKYPVFPVLTDVKLQTFESQAQQAREILKSQGKQEQ